MVPSRICMTVLLLLALSFAAPSLILATCGGGGGGGGDGQETYQPEWTPRDSARQQAQKSARGIVYYFPPKDTRHIHPVLKTKSLSFQSKQGPFVLVDTEHRAELREFYEVKKKYFAFVVTDGFGNPIRTFYAKDSKQRIKADAIITQIKNAEKFTRKLQKRVKKKLASAERNLKKNRLKKAIKDLNFITDLQGFAEVEEAEGMLEDLVEQGRKLVEEAKLLGATKPEQAIVALRKISRSYTGSAVEKEARALIAELKKVSFQWTPRPRHGPEYVQFCRDFPWPEPDHEALQRDLEVQALVVAGLELERAHLHDDALRAYEQAHARDPADVVPLRFLGEFHRHHTGQWDVARSYFEKLLAIDSADPYSRAIALHGLGKMTLNGGQFEKGLALLEKSVATHPNQLAYRNLAVYWNTEKKHEKARGYLDRALAIDPDDPYTRVFEAAYLAQAGDGEHALARIAATPLDPSMHYNIACVYSSVRDKTRTIEHLRKHFYDYEQHDAVRSREMLEARSDIFFQWLLDDPAFLEVTQLAVEPDTAAR